MFEKILRLLETAVSSQRQRSVFKREGAHRTPSQVHTPAQISQNVLCVVRWQKQTSAILTLSSASVIDL